MTPSGLQTIIEAADKITARVAKGRKTFDKDEDVQIVLVHMIQIIGEAAAGLSDELVDAHPELPWRQIVVARLERSTLRLRSPSRPGPSRWSG